MENINAILTEYAPDLSDETAAKIIEAVTKNYRTIEEVTKKNDRITELETALEDRASEIKKLEGTSDEINALKDQIAAYEKAELDRAEAEAEASKRRSFEEVFNQALGDRKFANDILRESVFAKTYEMCGKTEGLGAKDALDTVTKDIPNIWVNPQNDVQFMPNGEDLATGKLNDTQSAKLSFANQLFGSGGE